MPTTKTSMHNFKKDRPFHGWHIQNVFTSANEPEPETETLTDLEGPEVKNQLLFHEFHEITRVEFTCWLHGCSEKFQVDIYPGQHVYPKYCEKHRTEYQRINFNNTGSLRLAG